MNQEFSTANIIIPPWFFMLIYHLGDEEYARSWPQFRDIVSRHRHDHQQLILVICSLLIHTFMEQATGYNLLTQFSAL
jgi:hypothetical protein